jgi:hypothetical protein
MSNERKPSTTRSTRYCVSDIWSLPSQTPDLVRSSVQKQAVPTENSIALKKREQHSRGNEFLGPQKALVESQSCERPAVSAPGAEDHRRGVCVYIKEEAIAYAARRSYRW